ncbi:MAG: hypothetical protein JWQ70_978 [Aeromicrobium sp.]|nr:hypothetical protein [Aeromicrobium sp.]
MCGGPAFCHDAAVKVTRGAVMTATHRDRLRASGVEAASLDATTWRAAKKPFPGWWHDDGNALYLAEGAFLPDKTIQLLTTYPVHDVLIAIGSPMRWLHSLSIGGDSATVFIDQDCSMTAGDLYCGDQSSIVLHGPVIATRSAIVDARNGGSIVADADQLWAANVYIATDDMHRLEDRTTGERLNPYGAHIRIGRHVWLGRDAVVTGHSNVGDGAVVGHGALVRGQKVPAHTAVAGVPARVVRENIAWTDDDTP